MCKERGGGEGGARREERGKYTALPLLYFLPLLLPLSPSHISLYIHMCTIFKKIQLYLLLFMHAIKIFL